MREADRAAARKAAAQRAQRNAKESQALAAERAEYEDLARRLKPAARMALDAEKRRNYEGVVQVHGKVRSLAPPRDWLDEGLFRSTEKYFGAFELFDVELPLPYDHRTNQRVTVYLTSRGDLAYGIDLDRVTVRSVYDYQDVLEKDLAQRSAWLRTTPRPGQWLMDDPDRNLPNELREELDVWKQIGLRRVVEALERLGRR
jgi:hypothetical protein